MTRHPKLHCNFGQSEISESIQQQASVMKTLRVEGAVLTISRLHLKRRHTAHREAHAHSAKKPKRALISSSSLPGVSFIIILFFYLFVLIYITAITASSSSTSLILLLLKCSGSGTSQAFTYYHMSVFVFLFTNILITQV